MKKKTFELRNYVIATGVFIMAVVVGILLFFGCVQRSVAVNSREIVMTNVSRQSEYLKTILDIHYQYLNEIASEMGKSEELFSRENKDRLISIHEGTDLERMALIDVDGTAYYDNSITKNVFHRRYFQEAIAGKQTISDPLESSVDQEIRVVLCVPVYKDEEVIGVLGGSYNVTALSHMMFDDLFDGAGSSFIVTSEGLVIAFDSSSMSDRKITYDTNMFSYYGEKNLKGEHTLEALRKDFQEGNNGLVELSIEEHNEPDRYLAYMSLGYNDWMICYTVPITAAQQNYAFISKYEIIFMGSFCILAAILVLYIVWKNNREKTELMLSAQKDALTGVYNKESTQKYIDSVLAMKDPYAVHGFVIMDMDRFKDVNDTYGHIVGDKVLKEFGALLQTQFRDLDVVGRIGGDEFVVLLYDIGSRKNMESRVKGFQDKIRAMEIEELQGRHLTISAGIAFAPQDGNNFMELYRRADNALYQTKRAGRDGYHVYEKTIG